MAIIVEDGSLVAGANSYISEEDLLLYAQLRRTDVDDPEMTIIKAMDFFESYSARFKGSRVERDQPLSWPRSGAVIENWSWSSTEIPRQVLNSVFSLCIEIAEGVDPYNPPQPEQRVKKKKVEGAVEIEYEGSGGGKVSLYQPSSTHINLLLKHSGLQLVRT